jgi:YHS domain-containing protein
MKSKVMVLTLAAAFSVAGLVYAEEMPANEGANPDQAVEQPKPELVKANNTKCPVCGIEIPTGYVGAFTAEYNGKIYNVCSPNDRDMFMEQPERYSKIAETGVDSPTAPDYAKTPEPPPAMDDVAAPPELPDAAKK